jgi:antitoxin VapB
MKEPRDANTAEAAHARGTLFDKRRDLMADRAQFCDTVVRAWIHAWLPHTLILGNRRVAMDQRTARVGNNNRTQIVTIPLEYRFPEGMKEVFIRKVGDDIVLSPRPKDWSAFLAAGVRVSEDFMADADDLPLQERDTA